MPTQCCVPQCNQKGGHSFPWSNKDLFQKWIIAVKRADKWKPTKYSVVCKAHFDRSDYVELNYYGNTPMQKRLKPDAVPHIFNWIDSSSMATSDWIQQELKMKRDQVEAETDPLAVKYVGAIEEDRTQQTEVLIMPQRKKYGSSYCSAVGCTNSLRKCTALSFFRFPKDEARCKLWVVNSRRVDLYKFGTNYLYENCRLCALHFEDSEFMNPALKNKLIWSAVPTLFPNESNPSSQTTCGKSLEEEQYLDDLSTATPPSQNEVPQSPKRNKLDREVLNLRVARSRLKRKAKSPKKASNTDPKTYTEDMMSRMPEAECSPIRRSSSSNFSSSINMLSINNEENCVQESHKCSLCNKRFPQKALLETHMEEHDEKSYECNVCNKIFKCKSHLKVHMDIHSQENIYECDICYSRFVQKNHLKSHMTLHDRLKKYECNICHKGFTLQRCFNAHMNMHNKGKRYECSLCNRRFTCKKYLAGHMVVHTKEKKYECNICGKRFTQRSSIKPHMVLHSGEQNYECDICKKKFNYKQNVRKHMKLHTGEKKYECDICKKCFAENCGLKSHMLSHSKVKKYDCHLCDKKFKSSAHLGSHLAAHSGEKNFGCDICKKRFKRNENLKKHKALHKNNFKVQTIHQCHICDEKYELESMFKQHVLSHSIDRDNETPFEFVEIPSFVKKETDDSSYGDTSENIFDNMCDETQDQSCTIKLEVDDIKTENYFEDI